jgi:hypothetical protein
MANKIFQYSIGKDNLYFFYRFIVLPWELEWINCRFLVNAGDLKKFCMENEINIKSYESTDKLNEALLSEYQLEEKSSKGMLWFVRQDTKPKDTLRHLRNCFAHANYKKRRKNRVPCVVIKNIDRGKIKAQGFIPLNLLKDLVRSAEGCKV